MTEETRNLQIEVRAGNANQTAVGLTANEPVEPFTVGTAGSWQIFAEGVADVHAYLFFDGVTLFVSSVDPQNPAYANGQAVGTDWVPLVPGSEIALGAARLVVDGDEPGGMRAEPDPEPTAWGRPQRPPLPTPPPPDESTVLRPVQADDFGPAPYPPVAQAASQPKPKKLKIRQSARENPPDDDEATRFAPLDASAPPAPSPAASQRPMFIGGEGALPPSASTPPPAPWAPSGVAGPRGGFAPPGVQPPVPGGAPMPGGPPMPGGAPMPGGFPMPGAAPMPGGFPMPGAAPMPGGPPVGGPPIPSGPPPMPGAFTDSPHAITQNSVAKSSPLQVALAHWKNASIPQKAILVLMPFAFVSMFIVMDDGDTEEAAPTKPTASAVSAAPEAPASAPKPNATTEPVASADTPDAESAPESDTKDAAPEEAPPKLAKGEKTKQRQAADALASGNDTEALALYEELAKENPKDTAYKDIVRILKARTGGK